MTSQLDKLPFLKNLGYFHLQHLIIIRKIYYLISKNFYPQKNQR